MSSEPRSLSGQSSLDPCLPEESPDDADIVTSCTDKEPAGRPSNGVKRPDTLPLKCYNKHKLDDGSSFTAKAEKQKFLYRSNSSRTYKRPKPKVKVASEFDKIYFISSNKDDECYDSIDVIDERRSKNFKQSGGGGFYRSSTVIYSEYCSGSTIEPSTTDSLDQGGEAEKSNEGCTNGQHVQHNEMKKRNDNDAEVNGGRAKNACNLTNEMEDVSGGSLSGHNRHPTADHEQTTITVQAEIAGCGVVDADSAADD